MFGFGKSTKEKLAEQEKRYERLLQAGQERQKEVKELQEYRARVEAKRQEVRKVQEYNALENPFRQKLQSIRAVTSPVIRKFESKLGPMLKDTFEKVGKAAANTQRPVKSEAYKLGKKGKKQDSIWG